MVNNNCKTYFPGEMQICIGKTRNTETNWAESGVTCLNILCKLIQS